MNQNFSIFLLQVLLVINLIMMPAALIAQSKDTELPNINIGKTKWKVLFQSFANELKGPYSNQIAKIMPFLAKSLAKFDRHVLAENTKNNLREHAIQKELYQHYEAYNNLIDKRDRQVINATLKSRSRFHQITAEGNDEREINKKNRLIKRIQNIKRNSIAVPNSLPLEFADRSAKPYEAPTVVLLKEDFDMILWGESRGSNNVFEVKIWAYIANSKSKKLLWKGIIGASNYQQSLEMIRARASSLLLGRLWAALKIDIETSNNSDAKIYLDGKLEAENSLVVYGLQPKQTYELEIIANGLQGKHLFLELEPGKLNHFQFKLDIEIPEQYINVDASSSADVYLGVRYLGITPLKVRCTDL